MYTFPTCSLLALKHSVFTHYIIHLPCTFRNMHTRIYTVRAHTYTRSYIRSHTRSYIRSYTRSSSVPTHVLTYAPTHVLHPFLHTFLHTLLHTFLHPFLHTFLLTFLPRLFQVHGIIRRSSSFNTGRIEHLYADPKSHKQGGKLHHPTPRPILPPPPHLHTVLSVAMLG